MTQTIDKAKLTSSIISSKFSSRGLEAMSKQGLLEDLKKLRWKLTEPYSNKLVDASLIQVLAYFNCSNALKYLFENNHLNERDAKSILVGGSHNLTTLFLAADKIHAGQIDGIPFGESMPIKSNVIEILSANGADPWIVAKDGEIPFSAAIRNGQNFHILKLLPKMLENPDALSKLNALKFLFQTDQGQAVINLGSFLIHTKKIGILKEIAKAGLNIDSFPVMKCDLGTILHTLANSDMNMADYMSIAKPIKDKVSTVDVMAKKLNAPNAYDITPLHWSAMNPKNLGPLLALLTLGANADLKTTDGLLAIMFAAIALNDQAATILLEKTSPLSLKESRGTIYAQDKLFGSELFPGENKEKHTTKEFFVAAKILSEKASPDNGIVWDCLISSLDIKIQEEPSHAEALGGGDSLYE